MNTLVVKLVTVLFCILLVGESYADGDWDVYVNRRKFNGPVQGTGETLMVDGRAFARAIGVSVYAEAAEVKLNGVVIEGATVGADHQIMLPLLSSSRAIGCRVTAHPEGRRIDVEATRGFVPPEVEKAILHVPRISNDLEINFLYGIVLDAYEKEGLKFYHPVHPHWVSLQFIQARGGQHALGFSQPRAFGYGGVMAGIESMEAYIPYGLPPDKTLHTLAHELAHCWQFDNGIMKADPLYMEGFCEWMSVRVLTRLKLEHEIDLISRNLYAQYSQGYEYFKALEARVGFEGCLQEMKMRGQPKQRPR